MLERLANNLESVDTFIPDVIILLNEDFYIMDSLSPNGEAYKGKSVFELNPEFSQTSFRHFIQGIQAEGKPNVFEYEEREDGKVQQFYQVLAEPFLPGPGAKKPWIKLVIRNTTSNFRITQFLNSRLKFENLIVRLSSFFINLGYKEIDDGIVYALQEICEFTHLDRSFIVLFSEDKKFSSIQYEYCQDGIGSIFDQVQQVPFEVSPWLFGQLLNDQYVAIRNQSSLPESETGLAGMMTRLGTQSFIHVPLEWQGEVIGFIGFDSLRKEIDWRSQIVNLLQLVGRMLTNIVVRKADETKIRKLTRELEERIRDRTKKLENANQELEAFVYSISHDLRSPIRLINNFAGLLRNTLDQKSILETEAGEYLDFIQDSARKMEKMTSHLLNFSRVDQNQQKFSIVPMQRIVDKIIVALKSETRERNITWTVLPLPDIWGDPELMYQVWMNLISNAVKYTGNRDQATIEIGFRGTGFENGNFYIKDNGAGFDMEYASKLFTVFQRLHKNDEFEGQGIGLAIVRRIIHKHNGHVWASSEKGKGATFCFSVAPFPKV